jgi:hypothetical protein
MKGVLTLTPLPPRRTTATGQIDTKDIIYKDKETPSVKNVAKYIDFCLIKQSSYIDCLVYCALALLPLYIDKKSL